MASPFFLLAASGWWFLRFILGRKLKAQLLPHSPSFELNLSGDDFSLISGANKIRTYATPEPQRL